MRQWLKKTHSLMFMLIGFTIVLFLAVFLFARHTIQEKQTNLLLSEQNYIRSSVENHFHTIEQTLDAVADYIEVHDPTDAELLSFMMAIEANDERVYTMYLGKPDKAMVNTSGFEPPEGFDLTTRPWYTLATEYNATIYTPAFINATEDRIIVTIARPVYNGDTLRGVLATDMDISVITALVSEIQVGEKGYAYMFDQNGSLLAHPAIDHEIIALHDANLTTPALLSNEAEGIVKNIEVENTVGVIASSSMADGIYTIGVFMPNTEFNETTTLLLYALMIAMALLLAVAIFLILYNLRYVQRPTTQLLTDILALGEDPNESRILAIEDSEIFVDVKRALNKILLAKTNVFHQYRESQRALTKTSERVVRMMESTTDIVFEVDREGRYTTMYGKTLKRLNVDPNQFIGKTVLEAFGENGH